MKAVKNSADQMIDRNVKDVRNGGGVLQAKPNKEKFLKEIGKLAKSLQDLKNGISSRLILKGPRSFSGPFFVSKSFK